MTYHRLLRNCLREQLMEGCCPWFVCTNIKIKNCSKVSGLRSRADRSRLGSSRRTIVGLLLCAAQRSGGCGPRRACWFPRGLGRGGHDEHGCDRQRSVQDCKLYGYFGESIGEQGVSVVADHCVTAEVSSITLEGFAKRDSELVELGVGLRRSGMSVVFIELDITGLV